MKPPASFRALMVVVAVAGLAFGYLATRPAADSSAAIASKLPASLANASSKSVAPASPQSAVATGSAGETSVPVDPEAPREELQPRAADEWQGMLVDMAHRPPCGASTDCGLALACREDGLCGPCRSDRDCSAGEGCVLDHCVPIASIGCRQRADCRGADALCVLSGLSSDPRGNAGMLSECLASVGGKDRRKGPEPTYEPAPEPAVSPGKLLDSLRD